MKIIPPFFKFSTLTLIAIGIAACGTLSEDECRTANWRAIGFADGAAGHAAGRIDEHRQACAEYGIAPILDLYLAGRDEGLTHYCTPENGFKLGDSGKGYSHVCPADLEPAFLARYRKGQYIHGLQKEANDLKKILRNGERRLKKLNQLIPETESKLAQGQTSAAGDLKALAEERGSLTVTLDVLRDDVARASERVRLEREKAQSSTSDDNW